MTPVTVPPDEASRLRILGGLNLLGNVTDPVLDGLVRCASSAIGCPISLISLVDSRRQWFKARVGLQMLDAPSEAAFCAHAILGTDLFEVPDAALDPRFATSPLVTGTPHMRFYAGVPLAVDGHNVGTLCVIDRQPRRLSAVQRDVLSDLARAAQHWLVSWREQQALRERERDFRQLAEQTPAIVYRHALEAPHSTLYVSPRVAELGFTPEQWIADPQAWMHAMHPDDVDRVMHEVAAALARSDEVRLEYRMRDAAGAWRQYHDLACVVRPQHGGCAYLQGVMLDISERVAAEVAVREAEAYRRSLFEQMGDGVLVVNSGHQILDANPHGLALLGYAHGELLGRRLHDVLAAHEHPRLDAEVPLMMAGAPYLAEWEHVRKDGSRFPAEASVRPLDGQRYLAVLRDVSQRHAQDQRLRQLSQAVEQSSESILITDLAANIEYANAAALASSGYPHTELIGQNSRILQSGKTPGETFAALWASLAAGRPWKGLLFNRRKDGVDYVEFAALTPIRGPDGHINQYLAVKEDVTEKRRMGEELDRHRHHLEDLVARRTAELALAKQAADAANAAKSTFLATMSHEIRTPMNGVVGIVDVLAHSNLTPYQAELTGTIRESAFALLGIIDDILDFSKIEAGHMTLEREPVALLHLLEGVCDGLQPMASGRGVRLRVFVDPRLPESVDGDALRLRQILNNLIGNAIKFCVCPERLGLVRVRAEPTERGWWRLQVCDNGIGMDADALARIFQPFVQARGSTSRFYGGTGLGLSICRRLVELFGGRIDVASEPDVGTTFTVTLPQLTRPDAQAPAAQTDLSGLECHLLLCDMQQATDWCAYLAASGAQARCWPDLPALQAALVTNAGVLPVVIIESDALDSKPDPLRADGVALPQVRIAKGERRAAHLLGPGQVVLDSAAVRRAALLHAVAMAAGCRGAEPEDTVGASRASTPAPSVDEAAAAGRLVLVAEDNEINQIVILRQLELLGVAAEMAGNGLDALAKWRNGGHRQRHALLLTDLHMPGLDGYELANAIRTEEAPGRHLPIVALTANALQGEADRCRSAGMDDYLSKPLPLAQLRATLARWLPTGPESVAPAQARTNTPGVDAGVLIVDDDLFQLQLLKLQLDALGVAPVQGCNSGLAALACLERCNGAAALLLLDLNMRGMDGVEFIRHLAERRYGGSLVLVSGSDTRVLETVAKLASASGLNVLGHLLKPLRMETLRPLIERWRNFVPAPATGSAPAYSPREIARAIDAHELVLHYQPKVALTDGAWVGVEALVRWQHPTDGLVAPGAFVAVAEAHGLIDALTRAVLELALGQARRWRDAGLPLRVAVNVSMDNLTQLRFPDSVLDALARHGVPATDLVFEVTESRLMADSRAPMDILARLRMKHIGLSIDDFGTGYSSLVQLRDLPFDELKIDRSFVHGHPERAVESAIFNASLQMAHRLGMTVVAEGVEDRVDWDAVRASGCDTAQGYFIARPMPADALSDWAAQWQQRFKAL